MSRAAWIVAAMSLLVVGTAQPVEAQLSGDPFTVVVIPDTQIYVQSSGGAQVFIDQLGWVVNEEADQNIVFVTHVGDAAQDPASVTEWDRIETAFGQLDDADIPYAIAPGNHDIDGDGDAPEYDARFGSSRFAGLAWFGGSHVAEGNRSSYQTLSVEGHELLFVHVRHLQENYGPVAPLLRWVDEVLEAHPDHLAFVTTHEFTDLSGSVAKPELQEVLQQNCTVVAVFSGHRRGESARGSFADRCDRTVHHVLTNYQFITGGGQGFLRTVTIDPLTLAAAFQVYSPTLDEPRSGPSEAFTATLAPLIPIMGDSDCDRSVSIVDALAIAQFTVGTRTGVSGCPLSDPGGNVNLDTADATGDGAVDIVDALIIAQCTVGISNVLCP